MSNFSIFNSILSAQELRTPETVCPHAVDLSSDYFRQAELRFSQLPTNQDQNDLQVSCPSDAQGAVDGIVDGNWGFHTQNEKNPWWMIDLGENVQVDRIVLFNRCDQGHSIAARNGKIQLKIAADLAEHSLEIKSDQQLNFDSDSDSDSDTVLKSSLNQVFSEDEIDWEAFWQNDGTVFYGYSDGKPRVISVQKSVRFIKLCLAETSYFHLDEVQIWSNGKNIAPGKKCTQSSISPWSKNHPVRSDNEIGENGQLKTNVQSAEIPVEIYPIDRNILVRTGQLLDSTLTKYVQADFLSEEKAETIRQQYRLNQLLKSGSNSIADSNSSEDKLANLPSDSLLTSSLLTSSEEQKKNGAVEAESDFFCSNESWYLAIQKELRRLLFLNPTIKFNDVLFVKNAPGIFPHMSDQYYFWWQRGNGAICLLKNFRGFKVVSQNDSDSFSAMNLENKLDSMSAMNLENDLNSDKSLLDSNNDSNFLPSIDSQRTAEEYLFVGEDQMIVPCEPELINLTQNWANGTFFRPELSYDGKKVLFAYSQYYPETQNVPDKTNKLSFPEDAFFHLFEMEIATGNYRQLTFGRYDDFDARYLPNGDIVFLSTRKGTELQVGKLDESYWRTNSLPDAYVRCGGDLFRPVPVFTLHRMNTEDGDICQISAFENFEWTPAIAQDGRILYTRWDYIDRFNGHFESLWSTNPDGTNAKLVYGNYTTRPQVVYEAVSIPNSSKLMFVASAHHSNFGGSLVLFDRTRGTEGEKPLERLTPDVPFPETEKNVASYYANPFPLSEDLTLVSWSDQQLPPHCKVSNEKENPSNSMGIYLFDRLGNLQLIWRDAWISCMNPIPIMPREKPAILADQIDWKSPEEGTFLLQNVYEGLRAEGYRDEMGKVASLRIVALTPKVQPFMNNPVLGISEEDTGKFVLGTVPVEEDGSAHFTVPSGIPYFFQALNEEGLAVQTMRSAAYLMPGETATCVGCHESRDQTPTAPVRPIAAERLPSKIQREPEGAMPLRYDRLVQPILDQHCVICHDGNSTENHSDSPNIYKSANHSETMEPNLAGISPTPVNQSVGIIGATEKSRQLNLRTPETSYSVLMNFADKNLRRLAFEKDRSWPGETVARQSRLYELLTQEKGHEGVLLSKEELYRVVLWMDVYAQVTGSFSEQQEKEISEFCKKYESLFEKKESDQ